MRKRLMALLLLMALAAACLPASAEEADPPAEGFRFSFTLHLNRDALSPALQDHAEGYAELLDALRFEGTWAHAVSAELFELRLSVIPLHPDASPVDLRFYGKPDYVYVTSPLLGEERVVLSNDSLLEFCAKAYEHLGVPLQYAALLLPYTWEAALKLPAEDWKAMADTMDAGGVISSEAVARLSESWASRVASDRALEVLSTSLGLDTGLDGAVQAIFSEVPAYLLNQVTGGEEIRVRKARERGGFEKRLCLEKVWTPEEDPMLLEEEKLFEMLDWNAPEEIQKLGRRKAAESGNIRCFLQPVFPKYSKNVWTNCALILAGKTDEELRPWLKDLLRWLQDMNWPGAEIIQERLEAFQDDEAFRQAFGTCMLEAVDTNDEDWAENLETVRR